MTKKAVGTVFNYRIDKWAGLENIKDIAGYFLRLSSKIATADRTAGAETFEEAVARLDLSDEDIAKKVQLFYRLCLLYSLSSLAVIAYGIFILAIGNIGGFMIACGASCYGFAHSFKNHFWYFQMKNRKLGCSLGEWLNSKVK